MKTVPVSISSTSFSNAASSFVHTLAVSPYGESLMSLSASASSLTCFGHQHCPQANY